jgi:hypothetical protein
MKYMKENSRYFSSVDWLHVGCCFQIDAWETFRSQKDNFRILKNLMTSKR